MDWSKEVVMSDGRKTHKEMLVWQRAMLLAEQVYRVTKTFPSEERFGLVSQMRRAAVSIPSNLAEGAARRTSGEYINFLHIAHGSLAELETQAILARRLDFLPVSDHVEPEIERVGRLLNALTMAISKRRFRSDESRIPNPELL
jgi:four helix bundle protein